jgi:hypothetical protein
VAGPWKLARCVATNAKDSGKLSGDRRVLIADLNDKTAALNVDEAGRSIENNASNPDRSMTDLQA